MSTPGTPAGVNWRDVSSEGGTPERGNGNQASESEAEASIFSRSTTYSDVFDLENESKEDRHKRITSNRGTMKWAPVLCSNDLVHGSWYVFCYTIVLPSFSCL